MFKLFIRFGVAMAILAGFAVLAGVVMGSVLDNELDWEDINF